MRTEINKYLQLKYIFVYLFIILFAYVAYKTFFHNQIYKANNSINSVKEIKSIHNDKSSVKSITYNKLIIIGDSRMEFLEKRGESIDIPTNSFFIALNGASFDWFNDTALDKLESKLDNLDSRYKYHVVLNMGVNDLQNEQKPSHYVNNYYEKYLDLMKKYSNVNFYFLSVNPITESKLNKWQPWSYRTNERIEEFNYELNYKLKKQELSNYFYCDSYNNIEFGIPDGIHYDEETDQKIIDFISNKCIIYN